MNTIIIETPGHSAQRYEIDLAAESKEFVDEFKSFVSKLEAKSKRTKKERTKRLSPKMKQASAYIDKISHRPESKAALAEADAIRKDWIRKYV